MTIKIKWIYTEPLKPGKYIVVTTTKMGNDNVLKSYWSGKSWSFSNQTFVKYLKEKL